MSSVDPQEVEKFSQIAAEWWDPKGKFKPLHRFNPIRLRYIRETLCQQFDRDIESEKPLDGIKILDVGCGGGLLSEPLTRMGATVTGIDASEKNIKTATVHAQEQELEITYRCATAEDLVQEGLTFDVVLNMEVIEHVADRTQFLRDCCQLMNKAGVQFLATLNRTPASYVLAIVGAEYVLRWLPIGTHQWRKFVKPSELWEDLEGTGKTLHKLTGVKLNPLKGEWQFSKNVDINYICVIL